MRDRQGLVSRFQLARPVGVKPFHFGVTDEVLECRDGVFGIIGGRRLASNPCGAESPAGQSGGVTVPREVRLRTNHNMIRRDEVPTDFGVYFTIRPSRL